MSVGPVAGAEKAAVVVAKPSRTALQNTQTQLAWLLMAPTIIVILFVAAYPLARTFYDSFTDATFGQPTHFLGWTNYYNLINDTQFRDSVKVTIQFTILTVIFEFVLGMIVALVVNSHFKGRGAMRAAMLIPWAIITVVNAQMWKLMYNDTYGVFNDILVKLHIINSPQAFIVDHPLASVAAIDIWKTTPFVALLLLAGLQVIPSDIYEAADVDGASKWQQFWRITLPLLRPALLVTLIFRTMDSLRVFDVFYVLFGNRPDTQTMAIYDQQEIVNFNSVGYGAAISVAIFIILGIIILIYIKALPLETRQAGEPSGLGALWGRLWQYPSRALGALGDLLGQGMATVSAGWRRILSPVAAPLAPARRPISRGLFWLLIAVIIAYLLFPFYWAVKTSLTPDAHLYDTPVQYLPSPATFDHYGNVLGNSDFLHSLWNSALVGAGVTILALVIGASAAYALARFAFRGRSFMMYLILSMTIFPQIAILGALYQVVRNLHLYDSLWALIVTYMLFTLPFTVWVLTSFFRSLPQELEEAAYVDGANPFQTFYKIMLPLAAPGMVTTGLLAAIAAWNEFLYALSFEFSTANFTVPLAINNLTSTTASSFQIPWGDIMAATVIVTIPLVALVLIFQRRIIAGMTAGAVKG